MWKNIAELDRPQMTIGDVSFACWIPKDTNTYSEYVIHTAFSPKQWSYPFSSTAIIHVCVPSIKTTIHNVQLCGCKITVGQLE